MSQKTEQPTPKRLAEARKKGELPRSRLLSASAVTAGAVFATLAFATSSAQRIMDWTRALFSSPDVLAHAALGEALLVLGWVVAPALSGALIASMVVSLATVGFQLNPGLVAPKLERVDFFGGLRRLFSARRLVDLAKGLLVVALTTWLVWSAVMEAAPAVLRAVVLEGTGSLEVVLAQVGLLAKRCALMVLVLGVGDFLLAKRRHQKDLMMSRREVEQEHKNSEGDPHHKAKRKALHKQLANGGVARGVRRATVVVVNPTHIAVALRYDESECDAPYVVANGREEDALNIRREARQLGIPVVKNVGLARSLIHYDVGEEVPEELYKAAAAVLQVALDVREAEASARKEMP
ncbi:MAG: EscU/YscU/HrcU family type III secretion system export apparatus switch protein [Myxococcota bacterium]